MIKPRQISSALKKGTQEDIGKRLKSAVQFKLNDKIVSSKVFKSRVESGATQQTAYSTVQTIQSSARNNYDDIEQNNFFVKKEQANPKANTFVLKKLNLRRNDSQCSLERDEFRITLQDDMPTSVNAPMRNSQSMKQVRSIVVTQENVDSADIKRRMKFDPAVRSQVFQIKILALKDEKLKCFLLNLIIRQKSFIEAAKQKLVNIVIDCLQDLIEFALGTQIGKVLVETLQFSAQIMECMNLTDMAVYFYSQTKMMASNAGQTLEIYRMKALIGLANCAVVYEQYESSIQLLKKCLQYAWLNNDLEIENQVYRKLAKCYYYLGNIEKATFYHNRDVVYDYELEESPLRQLSCDTLRIFLGKHYHKNYTENFGVPLLNRMHLPFPNEIFGTAYTELMKVNDSNSPSQRRNSFRDIHGNSKRVFSTMPLNGPKQIQEILETHEFDFQVYTPKHSCTYMKSESKCFDHLNKKKIHPQDVYHDPKYKNNPFMMGNLGVLRGLNEENPLENCYKYKLPLEKQISIRLRKQVYLDIEQKLQMFANNRMNMKTKLKSKILITHKNVENDKRHKLIDENKNQELLQHLYENLINKLLI